MSLTEFLLARIAEDEAVARDVYRGDHWHLDRAPWNDIRGDDLVGGGKILASFTDEDRLSPLHVVRWSPARVLAECEVKRAILAGIIPERDPHRDHPDYDPEWILRLLALPHADHPDYDEAWRP